MRDEKPRTKGENKERSKSGVRKGGEEEDPNKRKASRLNLLLIFRKLYCSLCSL